jgi:RNA polymerase sigma-70 factor, ECF subfamily
MDVAGSAASDTSAEVVTTFEAVYAAYATDVYRFCLSMIGDPTRAEDAAAQALAAACLGYERSAPKESWVRAWLFRIARNAAIDELRRETRWRRLLARTTPPQPVARDLEADVILREDLRAVVSACAELGDRDRLIVSLRAAAGLDPGELAATLGISENAAKVASHRAFRRLRERMEERR